MTSRPAATLCSLLLLSAPLRSDGSEAAGDRAFGERAAGFLESGALRPAPVETAIAAYEEALAGDPDNLRVHVKLMDAVYFQGYFLVEERAAQREIYERLVELATRAFDLAVERADGRETFGGLALEQQVDLLRPLPQAAEVCYWMAAAWGLWGMTHNPLSAVRKGVTSKVHNYARMLVLLDERYNDAAGLRILGRLYTRAPWVPFLTGWVDRKKGIAMLRRAVAIAPQDPENLLFLAEALLAHDKDRRQEALDLLREVAARRPRPGELVEDSEPIELGRKLSAELEGS